MYIIHCEKLDSCGGRNLQAFEDHIDGLRIPVRIIHTIDDSEDFVNNLIESMKKTF